MIYSSPVCHKMVLEAGNWVNFSNNFIDKLVSPAFRSKLKRTSNAGCPVCRMFPVQFYFISSNSSFGKIWSSMTSIWLEFMERITCLHIASLAKLDRFRSERNWCPVAAISMIHIHMHRWLRISNSDLRERLLRIPRASLGVLNGPSSKRIAEEVLRPLPLAALRPSQQLNQEGQLWQEPAKKKTHSVFRRWLS